MKLTTDIFESIQIAKSKWNASTDEQKRWHDLNVNEKLDLIMIEHKEIFIKAMLLLGETE
jgi:hypothetical protein